jgi:hypothetical protein
MISVIQEHYNGFDFKRDFNFEDKLSFEQDYFYQFTVYRNWKVDCFRFILTQQIKHAISNSYFIGVDWLLKRKSNLYRNSIKIP